MVGAVKEHKAGLPYPSILEVMELIADWAELRSVDYGMFRDGDKWTLRVIMSDQRGSFSAYYELPQICTRPDFLQRRLDKLCMEKRKSRMPVIRFCR